MAVIDVCCIICNVRKKYVTMASRGGLASLNWREAVKDSKLKLVAVQLICCQKVLVALSLIMILLRSSAFSMSLTLYFFLSVERRP